MTANPGWSRRRRGVGPLAGVIVVGLSLTGCGTAGDSGGSDRASAVEFRASVIRIETDRDTFLLTAEIAETHRQKAYGLMERERLPEDHGMLFVYDELQDPDSEFYMFRTLIPLDIAFIDADRRIARIQSMEPCEIPNPSLCRRYAAGVPFLEALEVNRGFFDRRGIGVGDRVVRLD